jgi:hypothetical protein
LVEFGGGVPGKTLSDVRPIDNSLGLPPT